MKRKRHADLNRLVALSPRRELGFADHANGFLVAASTEAARDGRANDITLLVNNEGNNHLALHASFTSDVRVSDFADEFRQATGKDWHSVSSVKDIPRRFAWDLRLDDLLLLKGCRRIAAQRQRKDRDGDHPPLIVEAHLPGSGGKGGVTSYHLCVRQVGHVPWGKYRQLG